MQTPTTSDTRTLQSYRTASDINAIVAHFHRTGEIPHTAVGHQEPHYDDVSDLQGKTLVEIRQEQEERLERLAEADAEAAEMLRATQSAEAGQIESHDKQQPDAVENESEPS